MKTTTRFVIKDRNGICGTKLLNFKTHLDALNYIDSYLRPVIDHGIYKRYEIDTITTLLNGCPIREHLK